MANKKSTAKKSSTKRTVKKVAKEVKKNKGLSIVIVLLLIAIAGFLGFNVYKEKSNYDAFVVTMSEHEITFENNIIKDNLELATEVEGYEVNWDISNENYLTKLGVVIRPSYEEGDEEIILKETIHYQPVTFLFDYIKDFLGIVDYEKEFKLTIQCMEPSPEDYINQVMSTFTLPLETYQSIGFKSKTCLDNVSLSYESNNTSVIDNIGKVTTPSADTVVTITVKATCEGTTISQSYDVKVLAHEFEYDDINNDFNSEDKTTSYKDMDLENIHVHNGMIVEEKNETEVDPSEVNEFPRELKLRTDNKNTETGISYIETKKLIQPLSFSFSYLFDDASHTTEKGKFKVYAKTTGDYELIQELVVHISENYETVNIDLSSYNEVTIKVEYTHEWSGESFVRIDKVYVNKLISQSELEGSVSLNANISKSMFLPFTTRYGGCVTWKSNDESKVTSDGTLVSGATGKVTLEASITYGSISFKETYELTIQNKVAGSKDPLEIYFIDLGTYGIGDCGECTYIKYNDIDIIVDGGDHFDSTTRSISEVFEAHTNDLVIDYLVITHPDSDHIGGLPYLFEKYQINTVYKFAEETFTTQKFKKLKNAYDSEPNCTVYDVYYDIFDKKTTSEIITLSDDIYIKFINTGYLLDKETNGRSVVFELFAYDTKVLMTGDADNGGSHSKLEVSYMDQIGDVDILKVAHHATENGTCTEFLNAVTPEVAIICNGNYLGNKHSHPNKAPLERMNNYSKDLKMYAITGGGLHAELTTGNYAYKGSCSLEESKVDRNGTITCVINDAGYTFTCSLREKILDIRETQYWGILFK